MRSLDLVLGALALTALGLVLSSVPAVEAAERRSADDLATAAAHEELQRDLRDEQDLRNEGALERTGRGQEVRLEDARDEGDQRLGCCARERLSPADRAARARTLRRVLTPAGTGEEAELDRLRLHLLLLRETALTPTEEREIS